MKNIKNPKHLLLMFLFALCGVLGAQADDYEEVTFPTTDKSFNGAKFQGTVDYTDETDVRIKINLSTCTTDGENVLSIGTDLTAWNTNSVHLYYSPSTKKLNVDGFGKKVL